MPSPGNIVHSLEAKNIPYKKDTSIKNATPLHEISKFTHLRTEIFNEGFLIIKRWGEEQEPCNEIAPWDVYISAFMDYVFRDGYEAYANSTKESDDSDIEAENVYRTIKYLKWVYFSWAQSGMNLEARNVRWAELCTEHNLEITIA